MSISIFMSSYSRSGLLLLVVVFTMISVRDALIVFLEPFSERPTKKTSSNTSTPTNQKPLWSWRYGWRWGELMSTLWGENGFVRGESGCQHWGEYASVNDIPSLTRVNKYRITVIAPMTLAPLNIPLCSISSSLFVRVSNLRICSSLVQVPKPWNGSPSTSCACF